MDDQEHQATETEPVIARLDRIEVQLSEFHRRSAHRESIIDRLNAENQEFRDGLRRVILEPVVTDLLRLYDSMSREAVRLGATEPRVGAILESYADEIEMAVERCGYRMFAAVPGEAYQTGRHGPAGTVPTDDPALDNTVAEVLAAGLQEIDTGKVRRPARARFHRYTAPLPGGEPVDHPIHRDPVGSE